MTLTKIKRDSLYMQLLRLLVFSAFVSFLLFFALDYTSSYCIDEYLTKSNYIENRDTENIQEMQLFIDENELASDESKLIWEWAKQHKILYLQLIKDNHVIFDSKFPDQNLWEEVPIDNYIGNEYFSVQLADGEALASIIGPYAYQFYNYAFVTELILCVCLFMLLVLLGIRKKMAYLAKLSNEIDILEGGSLDYPITVKGNDEIAALASGLENMRLSFHKLIVKEGEMVKENQRMVTEMSHDLRTPVTSIILYTEILKKGAYQDKEQQEYYLEKIELKARRLKQLTDHLFEYALVSGETEIELENDEWVETVFYDSFSETIVYLEQHGFEINFTAEWPEKKIRISTEWIVRILDNVASNIIKYADQRYPVCFSLLDEGTWVGIRIWNHVCLKEKEVESTGIGIQSIRNMMQQMGGQCNIFNQNDIFEMTLLFPAVEG